MFNNTFNRNRKDPLVDSIKAIMEDTHMRNQAEGLVCEAFGVLNKNALANEEVTPFELACEEIYNQLKEGVQLDELHGKGAIGKIAAGHAKAYKKAQKDDKTEVSTDQRGRSYTSKLDTKGHSATRYHQLSGDRATLLKRKAEGKKTNSDQLSTIRQNAKSFKSQMEEGNDGNLANNYPPYDKVTRGDVIAGRLGKDQMGGKRKKMEEAQIDELSRDTLKSYVKKASKDMRKTAWTAGKETESDDYWGATGKDRRDRKHISKSGKRLRGIQKATDRLEETVFEELYINLNEKALWAIENGRLQEFVDNLTEEEYDFLDEEIVNELSSFEKAFAGAKGSNFNWHGKSFSGAKASSGSSSSAIPGVNPGISTRQAAQGTTIKQSGGFSTDAPKPSAGNYPDRGNVGTGKNFDAIDKATNAAADKAATARVKAAVAGTDYAKPSKPADSHIGGQTQHWKDQGAAERTSSSASQASTVKAAGDTPTSQTGTAKPDNNVPTPASVGAGSRPSSMDASKGADTGGGAKAPSAGGQPGDSASSNVKKLMSMNESTERKGFVTVGNMRIKLL